MMEPETKEYIEHLLKLVKEQSGEIYGFQALIHYSSDPDLRINWKARLAQWLADPEVKKELDAKFDPHIQKILLTLENREAVAALLRTPTKGLPN